MQKVKKGNKEGKKRIRKQKRTKKKGIRAMS